MPQADAEGGVRHPGPEQHPEAHEAALQPLHTPASEQVSGEGQVWQALPPDPHVVASVPVTQVLPEQQPTGQEVGVHWQLPRTHCWLGPQLGPEPHLHTPPTH